MRIERLDQMEQIARQLTMYSQTVAVAESCTGGLLGASLTDLPGSSTFFLGGVLAYSNNIKCDLVGVSAQTLASYGAVSEQVASEMALGIRRLTGADWGLATTGIAGPSGGTPEKPVGTVWISLADQFGVFSQKLQYLGLRSLVRQETVITILDCLLERLSDQGASL